MFKVKMTIVDFLGDEEKYPCHFLYNIGDEFIYDGEKFIGKMCPVLVPFIIPKMYEIHSAGPRYTEPGYYYPYWYAPVSVKDPSLKKYDGRGFRNVLETRVEPQYHMANLMPANAWKWPPHGERTVSRDPMLVCPDTRTAALLKLEAFDLSDKGFDIPFFRRQMTILSKVLLKQGIEVDKILNEFSKEQIEGIYPALSQIIVQPLVEELELMGYLEIQNGKATVTKKGQAKLEDFKASLSAVEREALQI
ncbi:MAG: hypothetical protein NTW48_00325 [Chloroflexi bacterium]|nr:hypothetical protein [Chloroflexota bacterium]